MRRKSEAAIVDHFLKTFAENERKENTVAGISGIQRKKIFFKNIAMLVSDEEQRK